MAAVVDFFSGTGGILPINPVLLCVTVLMTVPSLFGKAGTDGAPSVLHDTVTSLIISGNRTTKTETIQYYSGIRLGMRYDSLKLEEARKRLKASGLFYKVDLFALRASEGYRIYIIVTEKLYWLPYDLGGELYSYRYGKADRWWRLRVGLENTNFRGKAEVLRTSFSIWEWHSIGIGWLKPFYPSPWYFAFGINAEQLPDDVFRIDHSIVKSSLTVGRKLPFRSRAELSVMPLYRRRILYDQSFAVHDTERVYEAFTMLRWRTDFRDNQYDPGQGWMLLCDLRTNSLYSGIAPDYFEFYNDLRWYNPGVLKSHRIALRMTSTIRPSDAGSTHRLQLGAEGSVRGFARSQFGRRFIANNSLTLSMEYRFPLYEFPEMDLFPLSRIHPLFSVISYRLDGAFIIDYGRVASKLDHLLSFSEGLCEEGMGTGFGLRIVTPTFERSVCFDIVWGTDPDSRRGYLKFLKRPMWHFYLDMYF